MNEIEGNLITLAKAGVFDVIAHGCNCFCKMANGIAPQMAKEFGCDNFWLEGAGKVGLINKLGVIDYNYLCIDKENKIVVDNPSKALEQNRHTLAVVNCYTQYSYDKRSPQISYEALGLCLVKLNHTFKGKHIGLPKIGCGLAGGDWDVVSYMIKQRVKDCKVTIVHYDNT